ncbi:helix-turn-helix domain-containing protein [Ferrovibrio sp.]|uniref:helix-turn-helix domain-containing protein n=1 Tax=Ferrovibrio sp. TaxID=1917215 RepID=UPI003D28EE2B
MPTTIEGSAAGRSKGAKSRGPNQFDSHVGRRLRAARTLAGISQTRLGEAVGLTFQQIQKYEKGMNRIGASRLQQFAHILNVPPSYFFEGQMDEGAALAAAPATDEIDAETSGRVSQRQAMELVRYFSRIDSKSLRRHIFDLVKAAGAQPGEVAGPSLEEID